MKPLAFDRPRINAFGGRNNCFPVALAQDHEWATGQRRILSLSAGDPPTSATDIIAALRQHYGCERPHGLDPSRLELHRQGLPAAMTRIDIEQDLRRAGHGTRGFVFVDGVNGPEEPGHIFNAVNAAGQLFFWDAQCESDGSFWFDTAAVVYFYRTGSGLVGWK
jgi:Papain fold toxin 1, glutamine deamidase